VAPVSNITQLRELLAAKFPQLPVRPAGYFATGVPRLDGLLGEGLPLGGITEVVSQGGGGLLLHTLLRASTQRSTFLALIDARDSFDATALPAAMLARLLWVRAGTAEHALKAADLLLRDGNLPLVVLDLRASPPAEVRRLPATSWYRLQRVVEPTATAFVVLTHQGLVSSARARLRLTARFALNAFERRQTELLQELDVAWVREQPERIRRFA
jgi:hypothetical protein